MFAMIPLNGNVVVKPAEANATSKGGIHIPQSARKKQNEGVVLAVGKGRVLDNGRVAEPQVRTKERVLYRADMAFETKLGDEDVHVVDERAILAVLRT